MGTKGGDAIPGATGHPGGGGPGGAPVERFRPTSGRVTGVLALGFVGAVVVSGLVDPRHGLPLPVLAAAPVIGVLIWAAMLRPRVWVTEEDLVLRNMLHTVWIPLAAIEQVAVRQVLAVGAGQKRYVSPAVGRSWRQTVRSNRSAGAPPKPVGGGRVQTVAYPDFVEERIRALAEAARARRGVAPRSDEQRALAAGVRRRWARAELAAFVVTGLLFLVSLLL